MKKNFYGLYIALCIILSAVFCLSSCAESGPSDPAESSPQESSGLFPPEEAEPFDVKYNTAYSPIYFDASKVTNTVVHLGKGVNMVINRVPLNGSGVALIHAVEVDPKKAAIHAGSVDNKRATWYPETAMPYSMMTAFERDSGKTVIATVNADFFGATCVNAFVKDGCILKDGHSITTTNTYTDTFLYTDLKADVPASAPMLFGVNGSGKAQIAPMIKYTGDVTSAGVKRQIVTSKLSYKLFAKDREYEVYENNLGQNRMNSVIFHTSTLKIRKFAAGSVVYKVDIKDNYTDMLILDKTVLDADLSLKATPEEGYVAVDPAFNADDSIRQLEKGDKITVSVVSPDGLWDGFETILGCRQALVTDGEMAYTFRGEEKICTLSLENTNGAQSKNVPRTAVGIKKDGTVVIFAVESLRYGSKKVIKEIKEDDSYGLNLPQLADFMIYYGIETGANFDGGGSTQLIARRGATASPEVFVRSSDRGVYMPEASRKVMNTLMVTTR